MDVTRSNESTADLLKDLVSESRELLKSELQLAKTELRSDVTREVRSLAGFGAAAVAGLGAYGLALATIVLGLAEVMPAWAAALIVTVVMLAVTAGAALYGWKKRVTAPLDHTQRTLKEDAQWTKRKLS